MSDNDGQDIVCGRIRRQRMVRDPFAEKYRETQNDNQMERFSKFMVRNGYSVSEAIRAWSSIFGLPKGF